MSDAGKRIRDARKKAGYTQVSLGKAVGVSNTAVSFWESGDTKNLIGHNLLRLAQILDVSPNWILTGKPGPKGKLPPEAGDGNVEPGPEPAAEVPLISWVQAGQWASLIDEFQPGDAEDWLMTAANVGPRAFYLRVRGDSMTNPRGWPSAPDGTLILVDPDAPAENGNLVVARINSEEEATFKRLVKDGNRLYLEPLNDRFPILDFTPDSEIVGVVKKIEQDV